MSADILQHAVVTLVALWAAWVIVRRVVGVFAPAPGSGPGCASCASGQAACGHAAASSRATPPSHRRPPAT